MKTNFQWYVLQGNFSVKDASKNLLFSHVTSAPVIINYVFQHSKTDSAMAACNHMSTYYDFHAINNKVYLRSLA